MCKRGEFDNKINYLIRYTSPLNLLKGGDLVARLILTSILAPLLVNILTEVVKYYLDDNDD